MARTRRVMVVREPKWRLRERDEEPVEETVDEVVDETVGDDDEDAESAARYFGMRREELATSVRSLDDELRWLEREGARAFRLRGNDGARRAARNREWAADVRSLEAATLARVNGERATEREWCDEAIKQAYDPTARWVVWDEWPGWADELCDEMWVERVVLAPSVLRRGRGRGQRVDVLVQFLEGAKEDAEFRAGGLELLRHEVRERLGRPVEIHVVSELEEWVWPRELVEDLLAYGVCTYERGDDDLELVAGEE